VSQATGYDPVEFTIRKFQLAQMVDWASIAIPPGTPNQAVNGCFRVTVSPGQLCLAAADQHMSVFVESAAVRTASEGEIFLPAKKLKALLGEAPDVDVTVSAKGSTASVSAGGASWSLRLPPPAGYIGLPDLSAAEFLAVGREDFLGALAVVRHAIGKDDGRPSYRQVRIAESAGSMFACAVDSNQFSRAPVPGFPLPLSVPGLVLDDLVKLLGKSAAEETGVACLEATPAQPAQVVFRVGLVTLTAVRSGADFPDVDSLFLQPVQGNAQALSVDKADLARALRQVMVNSDTSTSAVALIADTGSRGATLTVTSRDASGNSAEVVLPADWKEGRQLLVVNGGFLAAMLAVHPSATCEFRLGKDRGRLRPSLLLEDTEARVTGICQQMPPSLVGY
jgi:DNA polymerase III sliding clamp (beta) subunit (PCNA family)